ncbi:MAG: GntR family transcriptional regulator [Acidobacteria bacterium]|nr:GntR family transcriptional regulator [Acidobacteriota bacterium]
MAGLPLLRPVSMRETVQDAIRGALHGGRFQVGQSLSEVALASEMGVSRGPVREALLMLVQEGLVVHSPNRGFSVVHVTAEDMAEIHQVRLPLEATALKFAQNRLAAKDLARLESLKRTLVQAHSDREYVLGSQTDMEFHSLIWDKCGNARLQTALRNLLAPFFAYGSLLNHERPNRTAGMIEEEHTCYIRFLRGEEKRTAEACVAFHLHLPL